MTHFCKRVMQLTAFSLYLTNNMSCVGKGRDESSLLVFPAAQFNQLAGRIVASADRPVAALTSVGHYVYVLTPTLDAPLH